MRSWKLNREIETNGNRVSRIKQFLEFILTKNTNYLSDLSETLVSCSALRSLKLVATQNKEESLYIALQHMTSRYS